VAAELFVVDRNRITCAGGTAALDLMPDLIAGRHGRGLAAVAEQFIHHRGARAGPDEQRLQLPARLGVTDPRLTAALALMEANLAEPLPVPVLAARSGVRRRELERLFRSKLETTLLAHYRALRLRHARSLLTQTDLAVREVALACGFSSLEHFSRSYRRLFGRPPRADRDRSTLPPGW
jgi:AraC family transcriptional regulator, glycine betaine-responsive activator